MSSLHGRGTGDLLDALAAALDAAPAAGGDDSGGSGASASQGARGEGEPAVAAAGRALAVVLVGRPNTGKSTLFNRLIGEDRSVVHDLPGTTRDTVDTLVETRDGPVRFIDTAGMRRRGPHRLGNGVLLAGGGPFGRWTQPMWPCWWWTPRSG